MITNLEDIKKIRKKLSLTQLELAKLSGVSQSLIAKLESKRIDPSFTKVKKIFDVLEGINKKGELKVADIMARDIIYCKSEELVSDVVKKMRKHNISQLPVFEKNQIIGMISESVILESVSKRKEDVGKLKVKEIMDEPPPIVSSSTSSRVVSHLLKHFPIVMVTSKGKFVGVVTKLDVLRVVSEVD